MNTETYIFVAIIVLLLIKTIKQQIKMAQLSDFNAQLTKANDALTALAAKGATLETELAGALSASDTAAVLTGLTDLATKLATAAGTEPAVTTTPAA